MKVLVIGNDKVCCKLFRERAYLLGGGLTINGNQGTTVRLTFPVDKETEK